jgi:hypothetical protein
MAAHDWSDIVAISPSLSDMALKAEPPAWVSAPVSAFFMVSQPARAKAATAAAIGK